jgi:hypothetical protein
VLNTGPDKSWSVSGAVGEKEGVSAQELKDYLDSLGELDASFSQHVPVAGSSGPQNEEGKVAVAASHAGFGGGGGDTTHGYDYTHIKGHKLHVNADGSWQLYGPAGGGISGGTNSNELTDTLGDLHLLPKKAA